MKNFKEGGYKQGGGFGGRQRFGGGGDRHGNGGGKFGGGQSHGSKGAERSFSKPELYPTVCTSCGRACEVPFRPSADKLVYCSNCFGKKGQDASRDARGNRDGDRAQPHFKKEFKPERDERSYGEERSSRKDQAHEELKKQIANLESKVNRVIELLGTAPKAPTSEALPALDEVPLKVRKPKKEKVKASAKKKVVKKTKK